MKNICKKLFKILLPICSSILVISLIITISFEYTDKNTRSKIVKEANCINSMYYICGDTNTDVIYKIDNFIDELPSHIQTVIKKNNNWVFVFANSLPNEMASYNQVKRKYTDLSNLTGLTVRTCRTVFVDLKQDESLIYDTAIHEIGHVIDCEFGYISNSKKFYKLFELYKEKITDNSYYNAHQSEFFAYTFSEYCINKQSLMEENPDIYNYFNDLLSTEKSNDNIIDKLCTRPIYFIRFFAPNTI